MSDMGSSVSARIPRLNSHELETQWRNPSRMLAAENAAMRWAVLCPRQPRVGLLYCGGRCAARSNVETHGERTGSKVAAVTKAASGMGLASTQAMLAAGARGYS